MRGQRQDDADSLEVFRRSTPTYASLYEVGKVVAALVIATFYVISWVQGQKSEKVRSEFPQDIGQIHDDLVRIYSGIHELKRSDDELWDKTRQLASSCQMMVDDEVARRKRGCH